MVKETRRDMSDPRWPADAEIGNDVTGQIDLTPLAKEMMRAENSNRKPCFVVMDGIEVGKTIPVDKNCITMGRGEECDVVLRDDGISRKHVEIEIEGPGRVMVRDLDSTNGTFVRGNRIREIELEIGDKVLLGRRTVLKFELQDTLEREYQKEMFDSSNSDGLTGVYNRKFLTERIVSDLSFARRHHMPFTFVMFDLDHFKKVNDTYGHPTGDQVLAQVSRAVAGIIRTEDVMARYGGEEFAIIAQGIDLAGGQILGERIRQCVSLEQIRVQGGSNQLITVTASVGVATVHGNAVVDSATVIAQADENLYKAKNNGRNQVVFSLLK